MSKCFCFTVVLKNIKELHEDGVDKRRNASEL